MGTPPPNPELQLLLSTVLLMVTNLLISVLHSPGYKYISKGFQRSQEENGMDFVPDWPFALTELWYLPRLIVEITRRRSNPSWSWGPQWKPNEYLLAQNAFHSNQNGIQVLACG